MTQAAAANPAPEELVLEYQPTDESGQPIGNKTAIKGATWEEIAQKSVEVNTQIVRAYHRLKGAKPTAKPEEVKFTPEQEAKLNELGIGNRIQEIDLYREQQRRNSAAIRFLRSHANDYYVCDANNAALDGYLEQNGLDYTPENYEIAFATMSDSLAQSPAATPPAEANPVPPASRPRATPDIRPGELNGTPAPKSKGLTKADYLKMAVKDPKEYNRHYNNTVLRRALDKAVGS